MVGQVGGKAALVTHGHAHAFVVNDFFERMKNFGAVTQCFSKAGRTDRDDHQLLQIKVVVGVCAAIDHVHHGHRHLHGAHAAEVAVQRQAGFFSGSPCHGHADGQHGIGAQAGLVLGAVQVDQRAVQKSLLAGVQPQHSFRNFGVDVLHRLEHALAQIAGHVTVAQLDGFTRAGGRTRWHGRTAHHAGLQQHVALNGRVAPAVEDFAGDDVNNCTHVFLSIQVINNKKIRRLRPAPCASLQRLGALRGPCRIRVSH